MRSRFSHILCVLLGTLFAIAFGSCDSRIVPSGEASLVFSQDTLSFDTVFTIAGSATRTVKIYNPHRDAVRISSVRMQSGESFRINLDGVQQLAQMHDILLPGGDSLFLFVRATIDPADREQPAFVEDRIIFQLGEQTETLVLEAYGWDVELIDSLYISHDTTLLGRKPYLVRNGIYIDNGAILTIAPGCHFFMHDTAKLVCEGGIDARGTLEHPIRFQSDRLDDIYEGIRYLYVGGKWNGIYLTHPDSAYLDYVEIVSGGIGLYCYGSGTEHLTLLNSRIHNHSRYGLALLDCDALVANTEISNCAEYCVYAAGGQHEFVHTTIASFFNYTQYAIQTVNRNDAVSPFYISNLSKNRRPTEVRILNSVLAGVKRNCLILATPLPDYYLGQFAHNYLQTDTLSTRYAQHNIYAAQHDTTLFVREHYFDKALYYDFRLDSLSAARDIADSLTALRYPLDRLGHSRFADSRPDAGCYEYTPSTEDYPSAP